jgi:hypothetical protein
LLLPDNSFWWFTKTDSLGRILDFTVFNPILSHQKV